MTTEKERREFGRIYERKGSPYLWVRYRVGGREYRESVESADELDAEKLLARRQAEIEGGTFLDPAAKRTTVDGLLDLLTTHYENSARRAMASVRSSMKHLRAHLGRRLARTVDYAAVEKYKAARREEGAAPGTIDVELAILSKAYRVGVKARKVTRAPEIEPFRPDNVRREFLTWPEIEAIAERLPETWRHAARFAALTSWRKSEVFALTWPDVDFAAGVVRLRDSKNHEAREFPFDVLPELEKVLREQRALADRYQRERGRVVRHVFFSERGRCVSDITKTWRKAAQAAGVPGAWFHDLRRVGIRAMTAAGVPQVWAMKLSGHRTSSTFRRYQITEADELREAVRRVARHRQGADEARKVIPLDEASGAH